MVIDKPSTDSKIFATTLEEKLFVIDSNLKRRHLTIYQRLELLTTKWELKKQDAEKRMKAGKKVDPSPLVDKGRVDEIIGNEAGVGKTTVGMFRVVRNEATKKEKQSLAKGDVKIKKVYMKIHHRRRREKAKKDAFDADWKKTMGHDHFQLFEGDILEMGKEIEDDSVDLIFTDPPYLKDTLDVYEALGDLALRVLKPGGSLVTIVGHHYIFRINELITNVRRWQDGKSAFMQYQWLLILRHGGHARRVHEYNVWAHYKPLLWYYKGSKPTTYHDISDLIESQPTDKEYHDWQQSTIEAEHIIKSLTVERDLVLDPFMGSGMTGEAAIKLNRRFRGIEIDPTTMKMAVKRLTDVDKLL